MINKDEADKHLVKSFKTFCIIGDPINHTLSPLIHNTAFSYLNLNYSYIAFKVSQVDLEDSIHSLKRINAAGFNVTLPHKESIIKYIDGLSEEAKTTGAVNTVNNEDGKFIGYNTDIHGIITPIEEREINLDNAQILILGAGGSCRAALVALSKKKGIQNINIVNRDQNRLKKVIELGKKMGLNCIPLDYNDINLLKETSLKSNLIINTTSIGLNNESSPLKSNFMMKNAFVFDIIYRPLYTDLLRNAKEAGSNVIFGYEMLIHQAAKSFEIWTKMGAPINAMKKALFGIFGEPK
ncbi:MAG TPA: shikimate dehydrogenase [Bacillus sp. (in: firmicutes)]|nr:shikimate dehydrogenase [Bacillus sp. (in: firmicutes)]